MVTAIALVAIGVVLYVIDGEERATTLTVNVTGLPTGVEAAVRVDGEGHAHDYALSRSGTRRVLPGRYLITVLAVTHGDYRHMGVADATVVTVGQGERATAVADYRISMHVAARVAPSGVESPVYRVTATSVTLEPGPYTAGLAPGQILVSAATPAQPTPFAAAVVSLSQRADGRTVADVVHVPMSAVMPKMVVRINDPRPLPTSTVRQASLPGPPEPEAARELQFGLGDCAKGSAGMRVRFQDIETHLFSEVDIEWYRLGKKVTIANPLGKDVTIGMEVRAPKKMRVAVAAHALGEMRTDITTKSALSCSHEVFEIKDPFGVDKAVNKACRAAGRILRLGPISPECKVTFKGDVEIEANKEFKAGTTVVAETESTAEWTFPPARRLPISLAAQPRIHVEESTFFSAQDAKVSGAVRMGLSTLIEAAIGGGTENTELGLEFEVWYPRGVKYETESDRQKVAVEGVIEHTMRLTLDLPDVPILRNVPDPSIELKLIPFKFPIGEITMGATDPDPSPSSPGGPPLGNPDSRGTASATPGQSEGQGPELEGWSEPIDTESLTLPYPGGACQHSAIDLDIPEVHEDIDSRNEIDYSDCNSEEVSLLGQNFGAGPNTPDAGPTTCLQLAQRQAVGDKDPSEFRPGETFCVVTSEKNVALLTFLGSTDVGDTHPDLHFALKLWKRKAP